MVNLLFLDTNTSVKSDEMSIFFLMPYANIVMVKNGQRRNNQVLVAVGTK